MLPQWLGQSDGPSRAAFRALSALRYGQIIAASMFFSFLIASLGQRKRKTVTAQTAIMELRVIEKTDTELRIEIAGEDHTFMNVLKGELLEADGVSAATYNMNPEQSGGQTEPVLSITTEDGRDPLDALADGASAVRETTDAFKDAFEAAA